MIRVKSTRTVLENLLDARSFSIYRKVPAADRAAWIAASKRIVTISWDDEPICVIGLRITSFLGTGVELWILPYRAFAQHIKYFLRWAKQAFQKVLKTYGHVLVRVEENHIAGIRLARAFKLTPTGFDQLVDGTYLRRYEASWHL